MQYKSEECKSCTKWKGLCKATEGKIGCKCIECKPLCDETVRLAWYLTNGKHGGWA